FFFFSSRRRHTRSYGDWSSDVCSSDLFRLDRDDVEITKRVTDLEGQRTPRQGVAKTADRVIDIEIDQRDGYEDDLVGLHDCDLGDRKSTRLNSSHRTTSYAVFCLKKKN